MSTSTLTQLDPLSPDYEAWLKSPGFVAPSATVMHHTATTAAGYRGRKTIEGHRRYHRNKGYSDIAAQSYACPDGTVFTARPMDVGNWCHAYIERDQPLGNLAADWYGNKQRLNCGVRGHCSPAFGLETNAHFSLENPWREGPAAHALECALQVLAVVHRTFGLPAEKCYFHRQAEDKDCPGRHLDLEDFRAELARRIRSGAAQLEAKVVLDGITLDDCKPSMETDGSMTLDARALLTALGMSAAIAGLEAANVIHGNGRAYVKQLREPCRAAGWELAFRKMAQGPRIYPQRIIAR